MRGKVGKQREKLDLETLIEIAREEMSSKKLSMVPRNLYKLFIEEKSKILQKVSEEVSKGNLDLVQKLIADVKRMESILEDLAIKRIEKIFSIAKLAAFGSNVQEETLWMTEEEEKLFESLKSALEEFRSSITSPERIKQPSGEEAKEESEEEEIERGIEIDEGLQRILKESEEEEAARALERELEEEEEKLEEALEEEREEEEIEEGLRLEILDEVKKFIGPDLNVYGPFKPGEIVVLPKEVAELLVRNGLARIMSKSSKGI